MAHIMEISSRIGDSDIGSILHVFFIIPCTSSILFSEHCAVTPWTRIKWMLLIVLEFVLILWVVL